MGLTDNQKRLIQAVCQNDIIAAKKCAIACVRGERYEECEWFPFGLVQTSDYGDTSFLCPSETDAKMYIEQRALAVWLSWVNFHDREKCNLEQLREKKGFLNRKINF